MTTGVDRMTTATTGFDRRLLIMPALVLVAAALLGYAAGHRPSGAAPREQTQTASVAGVLLGAPSQWRAVSTASAIPGLSLRRAVVLSPGDASASGLLAGVLPAGQGSPLPSQFLARMRQRPSTAVVSLQEAQAYRYSPQERAYIGQQRSRLVHGDPGEVREKLLALKEKFAADELMVITITGDYESRRESYRLVAEAFA